MILEADSGGELKSLSRINPTLLAGLEKIKK